MMIIRVILSVVLVFVFSCAVKAQDADSIRKRINEGNSDTLGVDIATKHARKLIKNRKLEEGNEYIEQILKEAKRLHYENGIIQAQSVRASYYADKNEFERSDSIYHQVLAFANKRGNKYAVMNTLNSMGLNYFNHGDFELALEHHQQAAQIAKELNDLSATARYMSNMARIYNLFSDYENAIRYGKRAIELEKREGGDQLSIVIRMINLSNYFIESGRYVEAIKTCRDGVTLNHEIQGESVWDAYLRNNLGLAMMKSGELQQSIKEFEFARRVFSEIADSATLATIASNLAQAYSGLKNWNRASFYLQESKRLAADDALDPESLRYRFEVGALVHEGSGDYRQALSDYRQSILIKDSIYAATQQENIMSLREAFDADMRDDSIRHHKQQAATERELRLLDQRISKHKSVWLIVSGLMIAALAFTSLLAFRNYRKKQIAHELLLEQKEIIEEKNKENELLLGEIHHRVKNNLQVISSLLSLQGKSITDENARTAVEAGKLRVRSMELVHTLLYEGTHFSFIEMRTFTQRLTTNLCDVYGIDMKKIDIRILFPELRLDVDTAMPIALILNETIVNAFKHSYPKHPDDFIISIDMKEEAGELVLLVKNNGDRVDPTIIQNSASFGFRLIDLLTRQLRGTMEILDQQGFGFKFRFKEYKMVNG